MFRFEAAFLHPSGIFMEPARNRSYVTAAAGPQAAGFTGKKTNIAVLRRLGRQNIVCKT
jgi:hypothetical protein